MMRKLNKRRANFIMTEVTGIVLALAVAFFFVAMPTNVFGQLVSASGLPAILPAAAPPLSAATRMIVGTLAGSLAGMTVILLFLLLDRQPVKQPKVIRPFFANSDLAPMETMRQHETKPLDLAVAREKAIAVPSEIVSVSAESLPSDTADEPIFIDFQALRAATKPKPPQSSSVADQSPLDLSQWKIVEPEVAPGPQPRSIGAPDRRTEDESISALMARLETGLDKRMERGGALAKAPEINRSGVGLHSTLDELRKMAVKR